MSQELSKNIKNFEDNTVRTLFYSTGYNSLYLGHEDNKCSVVNIKKLADNQTIDVLETKSVQVKTKRS